MNDILRRELAPITEAAWALIEQEARRVLRTYLTARTVVDFHGPLGWEFAAINLGRLHIPEQHSENGVTWGVRQAMPLVELRVPFRLKQQEVDDVTRGSTNPDLHSLEDAARKLGLFEDTVVYKGFGHTGIRGILESSSHEALSIEAEIEQLPGVVARAVVMMEADGVEGPYALVLSPDRYQALVQSVRPGYPLTRVVKDIIEGDILWSPVIEGGLLISRRGGDFELGVGQDVSIGYASHDRHDIELYLTESFAFRVLEPAAAVVLR